MTLTPFLVIGFANNMILFDLVFEKAQRAEGIAKLQKILQEKVVGKKEDPITQRKKVDLHLFWFDNRKEVESQPLKSCTRRLANRFCASSL